MIQKFLIPILLVCCLIITGCAFFVAGAGTGAYKCGELKKSYQASLDKTIIATATALKSLKITITEKTPVGIIATIKGKCSDKTSVKIKIGMITDRITEVSVRSGIVGVWSKKRSELIHASIAQRL
ncbi:MAG: DUF3568 domain-containing protein [Desulfobacteraceae bacterium]|nr:DUF3568 domain-containing protein [Pseudomonadota bacterium]MBU4463194.1 DUF3568 domain-containing protein [Pseudomonadota bacterium]MCG2754235.1 DUF3568 domain-containing protein [Desulfobacteraceae bacterium]